MDNAANVHQSDIDAGREPARTMRQVRSAVRQDVAGAGARLDALTIILHGESILGAVELDEAVRAALDKSLSGLENHLLRIEEKLNLAVEAETDARDAARGQR